ncbi:MAG: FISUMP domain-containing protein [Bacteroidales bacterium]
MKDLIKILSAVLLVTAINACTLQEVPDPTDGGGAITITAQTVQEQDVTNTPGTKTTLSGVETHWKGVDSYPGNPDKIGIFSPQARTTEGGSNAVKNAEFTAQTSAKSSSFNGTMFWGDNVSHNFYAYYPRNPGFSGERTEVPISLASAQSQSAAGNTDHIGALDYMVATPLTVARGGAVSLTFNHVFVMIEFQVVGSGELTQIRLGGANPLACEGTIDLTQTPGETSYTITKSNTSNNVTVTLTSAVTLSGSAVSVYMMILPGAQSENLQIAVKIDGNWKEMSKIPPAGGFVRGKKYVVTLNTAHVGWNDAIQDSRDSQIYQYKTIGTQVWMTENLAYLPSVVGPGTGSNSTAYYYVYGYDGTDVATAKATSNYTTYGVLYNWPAAQSACPSGWHLPSDAEWTTFTDDLGGASVAGGKLKEAGTAHWNSPNIGATNESGFTALPGGYRGSDGRFYGVGVSGYWWSSTESSTTNAWGRRLYCDDSGVGRAGLNREDGFSVRCLRD